ncbi:uncharacterized protein ARMOST_19756 [Armillaria ostoyae]|uniref:Uncharacterized protein n=1 Tax=Armillaria ostoyae TaxID=47428 RepID=A0A284S5K7_ARMOS|nr:uncharacterized protein ARMOST_19756 [Armillaria ostoyae]
MKQPSPLLLGPVQETLKGPSQSPARAQAKAVEPAGHGAESSLQDDPRIYSTRAVVRPEMGTKRQLSASERTGQTDEDDHSISPLNEWGSLPRKNLDEEAIARPAIMKAAAGQGAANAQAVNRGHPVLMVEVPDEEDNTAYQIWLAKE